MGKTIVRDVRDITGPDRDVLEHALGERLRDDQRLVVRILSPADAGPEPTRPGAGAALPDWCDVFRGLSDEEIADVESAVRRRLDLINEEEAAPDAPREQWLRSFDALVKGQKSRNPRFDDSRESIYPVR